MKKTFSKLFRLALCFCVFCGFFCCFSGCSTPGETVAEVGRRHRRVFRNNWLQLQDDTDAFWLIDRPSALSDKAMK